MEITLCREEPICDFCSDPQVTARYPAKDFQVEDTHPQQVLVSRSDWAACSTCSNLVEAEKWEELEKRSVETFEQKHGHLIPHRMIMDFVHDLHSKFRVNRLPVH